MSLAPSCLADREKLQELKKVRHFPGKGSRSKEAALGSRLVRNSGSLSSGEGAAAQIS